jgi:RimJ/RimL family protein N-acetyltransferase
VAGGRRAWARRGLGTAAVTLLAGWAFTALALARLAASVEEGNAPSRRLAERCGFALEGRLRPYQRLRDGTHVDCVSYSLLAAELQR